MNTMFSVVSTAQHVAATAFGFDTIAPLWYNLYTWIFIGYKFLSRADLGLISVHFKIK